MFIRSLEECEEFMSADNARLRELLHSDKYALAIRYSLAHAVVGPGLATIPHRLKTSEVYYVLAGTGLVSIDGETTGVVSGQAVYIPPGSLQFITNTGETNLEFLCIVDPAWRLEDEEILNGGGDDLVQ